MRIVVVLLLLLAIVAGGAWFVAGRGGGPVITIVKPEKVVGQGGTLDATLDIPGGQLTDLQVWIDQGGERLPVLSFAQAGGALKQETPERVRLTRGIGKRDIPALKSGQAALTVTATRSTLWGWRQLSSTVTRDLTVRLEPPRVAVVSTHHFVNHGGAEMVVYRVTPADVESGVRVGDVRYPGYPLAGTGVLQADPALRVAFFALLFDQDLNTPIQVYARDVAGNEGSAPVDAKVFAKRFRRSRIEVPQPFLQRVVPAILENTPDFKVEDPNDLLGAFLQINGELRRKNAETIAAFGRRSAPDMLWQGAFQPLGNAAIESSFADHRTYFHEGKEVDQQVHLGFDLAVTVAIPVVAANRGRVLHADYLGIYGNCVIVDHGMGVQSLYAHLTSMDVKPGDMVEKGQRLGRSGMTGLAGGDHLHFTMLVDGHPVNSIEFWDPHWIEDRVLRKIREAAPAAATPAATGH